MVGIGWVRGVRGGFVAVYVAKIAGGIDDVSDALLELFRFWKMLLGRWRLIDLERESEGEKS